MTKTILIDVFPYGGDYTYTKEAKKNYEGIVEFYNLVADAIKVNTTATWDLGCYRMVGQNRCDLDVIPCIHCVLTSKEADYLGKTMTEYIKSNYKYNALYSEMKTKKALNLFNKVSKKMGIRRDEVIHSYNTEDTSSEVA